MSKEKSEGQKFNEKMFQEQKDRNAALDEKAEKEKKENPVWEPAVKEANAPSEKGGYKRRRRRSTKRRRRATKKRRRSSRR